jgi:CobQ-like glutamine amidotransferase family enzyme
MTQSKGVKPAAPEQPHKPAPKIVAVRPLSTDYQADPVDRFPPPPVAPRRARKSRAQSPAAPTKPAARSAAAPKPAAAARSVASEPVGPLEPAPAPPSAPVIRATRLSRSRDHKSLRIAHLYPSLLNVAGDGGNLIALQRRAQWRGIPVDVVAVEKGDTPDFRKFDVVLFHGGQDVEMAIVAADFARKAPSLRAAVDEGVVIFAVCAGLQLLGHRYVSNSGEEMLGAGILDLETRGGPQRFMQHAACEVTIGDVTETVVGFENHSGLTTLGPGCQPFGRMVAGAGNNGRDGLEGARFGNVFATYLHGPCLPKNPWLTDQLIRIAVGRAEGISPAKVALAPLNDDLERRAHEVALHKAMSNRGRRTALEPAKLVRGQKIG